MELRSSFFGASLCGLLVALPACGADRDPEGQAANPPDTAQRLDTAEVVRARAIVHGPPGSGIEGEVTLADLRGSFPVPGVQVEARITGPAANLAPGPHGVHIHETAKGGCVPPYTSAGGHFDPGPASNPDPDVNHPFHMGDLPNLVVDGQGVGTLEAVTSRVTLSSGPLSVFDENGSVIIIHEKSDQGIPGPAKSGVSGGARIACGVIERQ